MENKPVNQPWWLLGLNVVFCCLLFSRNISSLLNGHDYFLWAIMGVGLLALVVQFVRQFRLQHAQYSIRSLLILTAIVAVLCSIYTYLGFFAIMIIICLGQIAASIYWQKHSGVGPSWNLEGHISESEYWQTHNRPGNQTPDDPSPTH
jgi:uncharacterized membrane protein YphA (DoxX/SURF4 family)